MSKVKYSGDDVEVRFTASDFKIEQRSDEKKRTLVGYASLFNTKMVTSYMTEVIMPGAFDDVMGDDVRCLFNHDPNELLGRTKSGTLRLSLDERGLKYECDLPDTTLGMDLAELMTRGDLAESSFAFTVAKGGAVWVHMEDGPAHRIVNKVERLYDVSPVTYPAYTDTTVALRSKEVEVPPQEGVTETKTNFLKLKLNLEI